MLKLSLQDEKYKKINTHADTFARILNKNPLVPLVFAAAGFRFDQGYYMFTSQSKTERVIQILNRSLNVYDLDLFHVGSEIICLLLLHECF